jgi:hypothetical protein
MEKAEHFKTERGYTLPYWELVAMARDAMKELAPKP